MAHAGFHDPDLVALYDLENPWGPDDDAFLAFVERTPRSRVLDLGCGTGRLTLAIAAAGHTVTGVDPAGASLDVARRKPGAEGVTWVEGTSRDLPGAAFDTAVMTSHVAQFLVTDAEWAATLADLARALVPGGRLAFDTKDPDARGWERWHRSRRTVATPGGDVTAWTEVTGNDADVVSFIHHYAFPDGTRRESGGALRFRSEALVRASLAAAGFSLERIDGGWAGQPVGAGDGELVVMAIRE